MSVQNQIAELIKIIEEHNYNYYVMDNPTISDYEYDILLHKLIKLEDITFEIPTNEKEKDDFHPFLPIRDLIPNRPKSSKNIVTPPCKVASVARKRKSEGHTGDENVRITVTECTEVQEVKRPHFSPVESKTSTVKHTKKVVTSSLKRVSHREKLNLKKKTGESHS